MKPVLPDMNPTQLLEHFDRLSEVPDAVSRLRRFILDLAVRGKLVEQDPNDEPAEELLNRIRAEKTVLVKDGILKPVKEVQKRVSNLKLIKSPKGWKVVYLQDICTSITDGDHLPPPKSESGTPFLVIGNVRNKAIDFYGCRHVPYSYYKNLDVIRRPIKGDVLYTLVGSYGIPVIVRDNRLFCVQRHIGILRPSQYFNFEFLALLLASTLVFDQATECATGIAQKTVPLSGLRAIKIPIPPLAEQHRIVAKVDELMAQCDQLEAAKTQREQSRDRLVAASLQRLNQPADDKETFREDVRFTFNHLPRITTRPAHIKQLRQTILNLAVRGKLVEQDPKDEPAAELLKRIWAEKIIRLTPRHQIANGENTDIAKEINFASPQGWRFVRFVDYALDISTGPFGSALHQSDYILDGVPLVNPSHMVNDRIIPDRKVTISEDTANRLATYRMRVGDIVMARRGEVGRAAIVSMVEEGWLCGTGSFFVRFNDEIFRKYILLLLRSDSVRKYLSGEAVGTTMVNLNHGILKKMPLAIPPLAEQHRIVAKVDELMALCDQLEAQLTTTEADSRRLLEAVLHETLSPPLAEAA